MGKKRNDTLEYLPGMIWQDSRVLYTVINMFLLPVLYIASPAPTPFPITTTYLQLLERQVDSMRLVHSVHDTLTGQFRELS